MITNDGIRHVVVVDDDRTIQKMAGTLLRDAGMRVTPIASGREMLSYLRAGNDADLILLDILMPEMDGFETLSALREFERENDERDEIPVIFLTGDDDKAAEAKGFSMGATDFIRKPFDADVLLHRVDNVISSNKQIKKLSEENQTDPLTGLLNKTSTNRRLEEICKTDTGILLVIDLDNFKPVNDIYGHDMGDKILSTFSDLLKEGFRSEDILGRIGGDEFLVFMRNAESESIVADCTRQLNDELLKEAYRILGKDMSIPLGVSVGAACLTGPTDYGILFKRADRELLAVKQAGKHGYRISRGDSDDQAPVPYEENNLLKLRMILDERNTGNHALWLGQEDFGNIYRYMLRYFRRYGEKAYRVFFSVMPKNPDVLEDELEDIMERFGQVISDTLRNSDIMMKCDSSHFLLLLPTVTEGDIDSVIERIHSSWEKQEVSGTVDVRCEKEAIGLEDERSIEATREDVPWILVVDDSISTLRTAGRLLSDEGMKVTCINSGEALLRRIEKGEKPDLILLDIMMPGLDGFETLRRLRDVERYGKETPVIFLTGTESRESEQEALSLGAVDFVKKPFEPGALVIRVRRALEISRIKNRRR
ncbi:MAG: response regulator [Lachnospiraceae bacterium]|nr:response regulator [Lachnospiraceae bacterium]